MNKWILVKNLSEYEDAVDFQTFNTKEKAIELYEEWKSELKECVDDTGFTGDEGLYIAKITDIFAPVTAFNAEGTAWGFEWEEFKGGNNNE